MNGRWPMRQGGATTQAAPSRTWEIRRAAVDPRLVDDVLRMLHLDLLQRGACAQELGGWLWGTHWFPHLKHDPRVLALARSLPSHWQDGELCDPQILLQFPHTGAVPPITFHVDQEPEWAHGRRYRRIVGVALSRWWPENGGLLVSYHGQTRALDLAAGDAVRMDPGLPHSAGINTTGTIRYGVYFRWLEPPGADPAADQLQTAPVKDSTT